jgi:predicted nucleic acid-binding protein
MIVLDASVVMELLLRTTRGNAANDRLRAGGFTLHAPHLLDLEVASVLRRLTAGGAFEEKRGTEGLVDLAAMPIHRYPHEFMLTRIWELRGNFTAYDAAYVALAEVLRAPLLTCDGRMARASGHRAQIEMLSA